MQTSTAKQAVLLNESGLQAELAGADGGCIARRAAADDRDVISGFGQVILPQ